MFVFPVLLKVTYLGFSASFKHKHVHSLSARIKSFCFQVMHAMTIAAFMVKC